MISSTPADWFFFHWKATRIAWKRSRVDIQSIFQTILGDAHGVSLVTAKPSKLLAEWFWTDRWTGSSAFMLPIAARGLYREMLTQAWRRGAKLPNDLESVRRVTGVTELEFASTWPLISKFWRVDADNNLVNDTQLEVYLQAVSIQRVRSEAGRLGGLNTQANRKANIEAPTQAKLNPPSPSPSPSLISVSESNKNKLISKAVAVKGQNGNGGTNSRSRHPIFQGQRFVVFDWMVEDLTRTLGSHTEAFDLHEWFFLLDAEALKNGLVIDKSDQWPWLQAELLREARRRGLPVASLTVKSGKPTAGQKMRAVLDQIDAITDKKVIR